MTSYIDFRTEPIVNTPHSVVIDRAGLTIKLECDLIGCSYYEEATTMQDAEILKEIHEEQEAY